MLSIKYLAKISKKFDRIRGDINLTAHELKGCIYNISVAARNGKMYKGYHWKINNKN